MHISTEMITRTNIWMFTQQEAKYFIFLGDQETCVTVCVCSLFCLCNFLIELIFWSSENAELFFQEGSWKSVQTLVHREETLTGVNSQKHSSPRAVSRSVSDLSVKRCLTNVTEEQTTAF